MILWLAFRAAFAVADSLADMTKGASDWAWDRWERSAMQRRPVEKEWES